MQKVLFFLFGFVFLFATLVALGLDSPSTETLNVESLAMDTEYFVLQVGQTEVLLATVYPFNANNQNILWSSSNPGVASVKDGIVSAHSAGNAQIFAVSEEGNFSDYCYVDVIN
jgi:uncharacterized protein YjdB